MGYWGEMLGLEEDKYMDDMVRLEEERQNETVTLIASENYAFPRVYAYSGSMLTNKYSEGRPRARYYGGTSCIDAIEEAAQKRALELFKLDPETWGVSVQPYSGSIANFSAYSALTRPGGKIMGMNLPAGGHLTHGFQTKTKKVSGASLYFESHPYGVSDCGLLDYQAIAEQFEEVQPDILICGYSAYSRDIEYDRLREIVGNRAFLYADISHISAIIAAGRMNSPFPHCDVVMTTTHKGLRGPRGALIYYRKEASVKEKKYNLDALINSAVFPLMQGGPHNHTIAGIGYALLLAGHSEFGTYIDAVLRNSRAISQAFLDGGYTVVSGGTDNHMFLVDLENKGVNGAQVEAVCDLIDLSINKNTVPGDASPMNPSGIRIGSYAGTTRGLGEKDFIELFEVIDYVVKFISRTNKSGTAESFAEWKNRIASSDSLADQRKKVRGLARKYPVRKE